MRVIVWSSGFWPQLGGLEAITEELLRSLKVRGVEFLVITGAPGPVLWEGTLVHRFPIGRLALDGSFEETASLRGHIGSILREFRPNLVHVNGVGGTIPMYVLCERASTPTIVTLHGTWDNWRPLLMERLLRSASWVATCSQSTLAAAHEFSPALRGRSGAIVNSLPIVNPSAQRGRRSRAGYLMCAGRLSPEKGFHVAVQALAMLPQFPELQLWLAGDGPERSRLEVLSVESGLADRVKFLGALERSQLAETMSRALAVLCPSRVEGFGLVALQAAQAGTPVLASAVGGLPEIVLDGVTGKLVATLEPRDWADSVAELLLSGDVESLGENARVRARSQFPWDSFVESYFDLYRRFSN